MKRDGATPLSATLESFLESLGIPQVAFLVRLRRNWTEAAGAAIARNSVPLSLRNGVLTIAVRNSPWAQELQLMKPVLLKKIRETAGVRSPVADVRVVVGAVGTEDGEGTDGPPAGDPPETDRPDPENLASVADPQTRESLRAIARRARRPA